MVDVWWASGPGIKARWCKELWKYIAFSEVLRRLSHCSPPGKILNSIYYTSMIVGYVRVILVRAELWEEIRDKGYFGYVQSKGFPCAVSILDRFITLFWITCITITRQYLLFRFRLVPYPAARNRIRDQFNVVKPHPTCEWLEGGKRRPRWCGPYFCRAGKYP